MARGKKRSVDETKPAEEKTPERPPQSTEEPKPAESPALSTRNEARKPPKAEAYIIEFPGDLSGEQYSVKFCHGTGVLDDQALWLKNRDWFMTSADGKTVQYRGTTIHQYAEYWWRKGATVRGVKREEADAMRQRIENEPESLLADLEKRFPAGKTEPSGETLKYERKTELPPVEFGKAERPEEPDGSQGSEEKKPEPKMPHEE